MGRTAGYSRKNYNYRVDPYIEGNAVRKPARVQQPVRPVHEERKRPAVSRETRRNRERAQQINMGYVMFLTVATVATLFVCVRFLQLQSESTAYRKSITSLESQLSTIKMNNDAEYKRAASSEDLAAIKDIAINELGMVYPEEGQVQTYNSQEGDYVKQYEEVPTE